MFTDEPCSELCSRHSKSSKLETCTTLKLIVIWQLSVHITVKETTYSSQNSAENLSTCKKCLG